MRNAAAYAEQLGALLPRGRAWLRAPGSLMAALLAGIAEEFARADRRVIVLGDEADPDSALELLPEWERVAGLPDQCLPTTGTIRERQLRVARKISGLGGQSRAYFIDLAAQLGIAVTIEEFRPFTAGMRSGSRCYGVGWRFVWLVRVLPFSEGSGFAVRNERFTAGHSRAGDRLRSFSVNELECIIRRAAPAHTKVLFSYPLDPDPALLFDFLSDQGGY